MLPVTLKTTSAVANMAPWFMWLVTKLFIVVLTVTLMKLTDSIYDPLAGARPKRGLVVTVVIMKEMRLMLTVLNV